MCTQEDLMKSQKEAEQIAIEEKLSKKGVLKELENVQQKNIQLNAEREELKIQLASNIQIHQSQMQKVCLFPSNCCYATVVCALNLV